ncbi:MAG: hypothetical protein LBD21_00655 [Tannerellaceae bacterium]|nr:hypothetical protein [Tannerellaceae bacterium]
MKKFRILLPARPKGIAKAFKKDSPQAAATSHFLYGLRRSRCDLAFSLRIPFASRCRMAFFSEGLREPLPHGIFRPKLCARKYCMAFFVRSSAQENTAWLFSSEGLRKKISHGIFRPKACARKYCMAVFVRSSAQENATSHFSPKVCARKCHAKAPFFLLRGILLK